MPDSPAARLAKYQATVEVLLRQQDAYTLTQVRALYALLQDIRQRVVNDLAELAGHDDTAFKPYQLRNLRDAIDRATHRLTSSYFQIVGGAISHSWEAGAEITPSALAAANVDISFHVAQELSLNQLHIARQIAADLVVQVSQDFRDKARNIVARGVAGQIAPHTVLQDVAALLAPEPDRQTGAMGTIAVQAERIQRTEMMGVFNIANELRHRQIAKGNPGLRKYWLTAEDSRVRPDHALAGERYAPGGVPGPLPAGDDYSVGGESCQFPHDPRLSAKERINCRCVSALYHPDWFASSSIAR